MRQRNLTQEVGYFSFSIYIFTLFQGGAYGLNELISVLPRPLTVTSATTLPLHVFDVLPFLRLPQGFKSIEVRVKPKPSREICCATKRVLDFLIRNIASALQLKQSRQLKHIALRELDFSMLIQYIDYFLTKSNLKIVRNWILSRDDG